MSPGYIVFWGVVITVIGMLVSAFGAFRLNEEGVKSQKLLPEKTEENAKLTKLNSDLISSEMLSAVTGGDSWFYLEPHFSKDELILTLSFEGKYPLFDTVIHTERQLLNLDKKYMNLMEDLVKKCCIQCIQQ